MRFLAVIFFLTTLSGGVSGVPVSAQELTASEETEKAPLVEEDEYDGKRDERSVFGHVLFYIPNRLLDLIDIVRLRVRVGPGFGFSVRATKAVQLNISSYATVYAGLPGPRQRRTPRMPIGLETYSGLALSLLELDIKPFSPDYSPTEFGVGGQLMVVGVDAGIDPYEIIDFLAGLVFLDLQNDDF